MPNWNEIRHDNITKGFTGDLSLLIPDLSIVGEPLEKNVILWIGSKQYFITRQQANILTMKIRSMMNRRIANLERELEWVNGERKL